MPQKVAADASCGTKQFGCSFGRLTRRSDFLAARDSPSIRTPSVVLVRHIRSGADPTIRLGFTVTKKLGGAVKRNRIKRRLRAACRDCMPGAASPGSDYILIARTEAINRPYNQLVDDLRRAVLRLTDGAS